MLFKFTADDRDKRVRRRDSGDLQRYSIHVISYGIPIRIDCDRSVPDDRVRSILPPHYRETEPCEGTARFELLQTIDGAEPRYSVKGPQRGFPTESRDEALDNLRKEVHLYVAEHAPEHVFVHAGVCVLNGLAVVCPGRSFSGKSTLINGMVDAGALYFSDEYAVFDRSGYVSPFPLAISLRRPVRMLRAVSATSIGTSPVRPDVLLFAKYRDGHAWTPRNLRPAEAILELLRHTIAMRARPEFVLPVLKNVVTHAQSYSGLRGETNSVLAWTRTIDIKRKRK